MADDYTNIPHVKATYTPNRITRYCGNPLIEALGPIPSDEEIIQLLHSAPDFDQSQREWPIEERTSQIAALANCMLPLVRHIALARKLFTMQYEGYVGRRPHTAQHNQFLQKIYEAGRAKSSVIPRQQFTSFTQITSALIGVSGMGKTTTVKRIFAAQPQLIYHENGHIWQIPYLHIEMPHDGRSVKGLAHSILRKLDDLIPDANYYKLYASHKSSIETLMNHVARLLHLHCVGCLICDELQNLENAPKDKQTLMTLLVSASNELGLPLLFIATPKAKKLLTLDFRQARRSAGHGLDVWERIPGPGSDDDKGEWDSFIKQLWRYQWVQKTCPLSETLSHQMYHHCQGIIDLAIKLFACAQIRALQDGTEAITSNLIADVAETELAVLAPMVDALRRNDTKALELLDDIAPVQFEQLFRDANFQNIGLGLQRKTTDEQVPFQLMAALDAMGVQPDTAEEVTATVMAEDRPKTAVEGTRAAINRMTPRRSVKKSEAKAFMELAPDDLRNAFRRAKTANRTVLHELRQMHAVADLQTILGN